MSLWGGVEALYIGTQGRPKLFTVEMYEVISTSGCTNQAK